MTKSDKCDEPLYMELKWHMLYLYDHMTEVLDIFVQSIKHYPRML